MPDWLRSIFTPPEPFGAPEKMRSFSTADQTLSKDCVTIEADGWLIDTAEERTIRLFEVPDPGVEQCLLIYRATMKSQDLRGRAYLEMWCRLPGRGEFFSRGVAQPLRGTTDWSAHEVPFHLKKGQHPDLIKLNLVIKGSGKVQIKDVELLRALRRRAQRTRGGGRG